MKNNLLIILFLVSSFNAFASKCSCDTPKLALEFLESKHVFLGTVIEKTYSEDRSSFKIIFEIIEHFKEGKNPKKLEFNFENSTEESSCDWFINPNERWLVFTSEFNGKLTFGALCSNSRGISGNGYPTTIKNISKNWSKFNFDKYIFYSNHGSFEKSLPNINLDSLISKYSKKNYGKGYDENIVNIIVDIDRKGNVKQINMNHHGPNDITFKYDPIFQLQFYYPLKVFKPKTKFEIDIFNEVKKIKKWTPVYIRNTNISVPYRKYLQFQKSKDTIYRYYKY